MSQMFIDGKFWVKRSTRFYFYLQEAEVPGVARFYKILYFPFHFNYIKLSAVCRYKDYNHSMKIIIIAYLYVT